MTQTLTAPLFDKIGGKPAVQAVVGEFYKRVLADADLAGFFANTDMRKQQQQQIKFITAALGGPTDYDGRSMRDAHAGMAITNTHFNRVAGHLSDALAWANVPEADIDAIITIAASLRPDIVEV